VESSYRIRVALALSGGTIDRKELALLCPKSGERVCGRRNVGINGPICFVLWARFECAIADCRSLEHKYVKLPADVQLVICNTMVKT